MNIQRVSNVGFKGFTNIVALQNAPVDDKSISYISALLDNEGKRDLEKLNNIKQFQYLLGNTQEDDVLNLVYVYDKSKRVETLYYQSRPLFWGDELVDIEEKYIPKMISRTDYEYEKFLHMKIYTFLAKITKRMSNSKFNNEDEQYKHVLENLFGSLTKIVKSESSAFYLLRGGCMKINKFQDVSESFNKAISMTMDRFFYRLG